MCTFVPVKQANCVPPALEERRERKRPINPVANPSILARFAARQRLQVLAHLVQPTLPRELRGSMAISIDETPRQLCAALLSRADEEVNDGTLVARNCRAPVEHRVVVVIDR